MSSTPEHLKYTKEHEWVEKRDGGRVRVGITDHAQMQLGDIVFVENPKAGDRVEAGTRPATWSRSRRSPSCTRRSPAG